ncbi:MAG: UbiD family decarboxylase, partial [Candidatus Diapherotrites archaeon]
MGFREYLKQLEAKGRLQKIAKPVSKRLEAAAILNELNEKPALFEKIKESEFRVAGNIFGTKESVADYLGVKVAELIPKITHAIEHPSKPEEVKNAACQEEEMKEVDLDKLPILFHCEKDGGNYISSGVFIIKDKEGIQNVDFHRAMQIGKNKFSIRVVRERHFDQLLKKHGELNVAACIGNSPNVLIAAATSVAFG